ncbi:unnamed protein product [Scytosiphon promiscuus]
MALRNLGGSCVRVGGMSSIGFRRQRQHHRQQNHQHQHHYQRQQEPPRLWSMTTSAWDGETQSTTTPRGTAAAPADVETSEASCSRSRSSKGDSSTRDDDDGRFTRKFGDPHFWEGEYSSQLSGEQGEHGHDHDHDHDHAHAHAPFEWFLPYEGGLREQLLPFLESIATTSRTRLLHVGCGTSGVGPKIAQEPSLLPLIHVTDSDSSPSALMLMRRRHAALQNYACHEGNALDLDFPDGTFDAIVDKGTLDALLCRSVEDAHLMVAEMHRILRKGGVYFQISAEDPDARLELLAECGSSAKGGRVREGRARDPWSRSFFKELGEGAESGYFMYVLVK